MFNILIVSMNMPYGNTAIKMEIKIPKVPHNVPVDNRTKKQATKDMITDKKNTTPFAAPFLNVLIQISVPCVLVIFIKVVGIARIKTLA